MIRYLEFFSTAALNDFLAAQWRRHYERIHGFMLANPVYPPRTYGDPIGWVYLSPDYVWNMVRCPKIQVIQHPTLPAQAIAKCSGDPSNLPWPVQWALDDPPIGIPSVAAMAVAQGMSNFDYNDGAPLAGQAQKARYTLGVPVAGFGSTNPNARMHSVEPGLFVTRANVSPEWDDILDALEQVGP